jgi:C4-dicarboxylate transporter DctQ subunit
MEALRGISGQLSRISQRMVEYTLVGMVSVMTVLVIVQVFLRYLFLYSLSWSEEVARFLMIWVSFLAASLALQKGLHIGVESLVNRVNPKFRRCISLFAKISILLFLLFLTVGGIHLAWLVRDQSSPALFLSMGYAYLSAGAGGFFMAIQIFHSLVEGFSQNGPRG